MASIDVTPREPFTAQTEAEFDRYINQPDHSNRSRVGHEKRLSYRHWLLHPDEKPTGNASDRQQQSNEKNGALNLFELRDGQLWKQATSSDVAKYVVCLYEVYERIKATDLQLEHAGTTKTYKALQARY